MIKIRHPWNNNDNFQSTNQRRGGRRRTRKPNRVTTNSSVKKLIKNTPKELSLPDYEDIPVVVAQ